MSLIGSLARKFNYSVTGPAAGRLIYREGNREYTFPAYQEDGATVVVGTPSCVRVHFFFNWYPSRREIPAAAKTRIMKRLAGHLREGPGAVRVFDRAEEPGAMFEFYPELFAHRTRALELLEEAGFTWFADYSSVDPVQEDYGLEISGIREDEMVKPILDLLQRGFPHWHHHRYCFHDGDREPGWSITISLFPCRSCNAGRYDWD